ncbi:MAG: acyl-ACP--UDP-N-acetylglucosamine O-acyltransferase, partial [Rubritalea sp.]
FHQFIKIGDYAICQGNAAITKDIPPYCMAHGQNNLAGLNNIGLRRAALTPEQRKDIKSAYKLLFKSGMSMTDALNEADRRAWLEHTNLLLDAAKNPSRKGIMMA